MLKQCHISMIELYIQPENQPLILFEACLEVQIILRYPTVLFKIFYMDNTSKSTCSSPCYWQPISFHLDFYLCSVKFLEITRFSELFFGGTVITGSYRWCTLYVYRLHFGCIYVDTYTCFKLSQSRISRV